MDSKYKSPSDHHVLFLTEEFHVIIVDPRQSIIGRKVGPKKREKKPGARQNTLCHVESFLILHELYILN